MSTVAEALREGEARLAGGDSPRLDAEVLLGHALGKPRQYLYAWPDTPLEAAALECYRGLIGRRAAGEPVAYLSGHRGFWNLDLAVSPAVLVPRPETELLVELTLGQLPASHQRVADLGTGSGAIALALAGERPAWRIVATDASEEALAVARANAARLGFGNVEFHAGDWCDALPRGPFDAILSNPPYIDAEDPHLGRGDLRFEPRSALVAGDGGLADIRQIAGAARAFLRTGGWLLLEHGYTQGEAVRDILAGVGYRDVATHHDLAGQERITVGRRQ